MSWYDFYVTLRLLILAVAIFLNGGTLVMIVRKPKLREQRNIFTFNLALADFVAAICDICYATLDNYPAKVALKLIFHCAILVSVLSVLAISCYRFIALAIDPFGSRGILTAPRCAVGSTLMWVLLVGPLMIVKYCSNAYSTVLLLINPCIMFTSVAITAFFYAMTYRDISGATAAGQMKARVKENRKVLRTFAVITLTSCVCWVVHCFHDILQIYAIYYDNIDAVSNVLVAVNFVLDPMIYWWRLDEFRSVIVKVVCQNRLAIGLRRKFGMRVGDSAQLESKVLSVSDTVKTSFTSTATECKEVL